MTNDGWVMDEYQLLVLFFVWGTWMNNESIMNIGLILLVCVQVHQVTVPSPPSPLPLILRHTRHLNKALCSADHCHGQCKLIENLQKKAKIVGEKIWKFSVIILMLKQELFKRVIPHQCLGSVWSSKSRERDAATVVATIEQVSWD